VSANSFGQNFKIHSFGESHGPALGVVIDGCPAGVPVNLEFLNLQLQRRRPGTWDTRQVVSPRQEADVPEILSGVYERKTLGTPIAVLVRNQDARSQDYLGENVIQRKGHADQAWLDKFGHVDPRGGGRSSGRETLARVIGGAFASLFLKTLPVEPQIRACAIQIGEEKLTDQEKIEFFEKALMPEKTEMARNNQSGAISNFVDSYSARFPSLRHQEVRELLQAAQAKGESFGGRVELRVRGLRPGLGQPVFHKLKSDLAMAMLSVGATSSFELGESATELSGTEFHAGGNRTQYGGILGGISTGEDLIFRVGFKPTSSILDVAKKGRHDPCIVPRAIPVLEAMTALVLADHELWSRRDRIPHQST